MRAGLAGGVFADSGRSPGAVVGVLVGTSSLVCVPTPCVVSHHRSAAGARLKGKGSRTRAQSAQLEAHEQFFHAGRSPESDQRRLRAMPNLTQFNFLRSSSGTNVTVSLDLVFRSKRQ